MIKGFFAAFFGLLMMATTPTLADNTAMVDGATSYVTNVAQQALDIINNKDLSEDAAKKKFQGIMNKSFDIATISRFTLGRYWRVATKDQQGEYTRLIEDVILNKYADRLLDYSGDSFEVVGGRALNETDSVVTMKVKPKGQPEAVFAWRVRYKNSAYKIIDLAVEGVSMSVTHRSDFNAVIQRNGGQVQALINALKAKEI